MCDSFHIFFRKFDFLSQIIFDFFQNHIFLVRDFEKKKTFYDFLFMVLKKKKKLSEFSAVYFHHFTYNEILALPSLWNFAPLFWARKEKNLLGHEIMENAAHFRQQGRIQCMNNVEAYCKVGNIHVQVKGQRGRRTLTPSMTSLAHTYDQARSLEISHVQLKQKQCTLNHPLHESR